MQNKLKVRRAELGKTQLQVARAAGMSDSRLSLIERGELDPTDEEMTSLVKALRSRRSRLFPGAAQPNAIPVQQP